MVELTSVYLPNGAGMKRKNINSTAGKFSVLRQLCNHIPAQLVPKLVREHKSESHAREFSHWSQIVTLLYSKISHSFGLNDLCDQMDLHSGSLAAIRGATPARRNTLSHAGKIRPAAIAEGIFWGTLAHLREQSPTFGRRKFPGRLRKLKSTIELVDSTVIELVANCMSWASHRRNKAGAKCHLRLNFETLLPSCAVIDTAREADAKRARDLTAGLKIGEIVIFDRGYVDLTHFAELNQRGVVWVTRWKEGMKADVFETLATKGKILADEIVGLSDSQMVRRIRALVVVDGEEREMVFLTNHLKWGAELIVELYGCRWEIELFFKQMKQTLKLCDFVGNSANAIRWQIWMALLAHLLVRYQAWVHQWPHSFTRIFALLRGTLWEKRDISSLLDRYGTAKGSFRYLASPAQAYFAFEG